MDRLIIEEERVSILRSAGVNVAFPAGMSRLDLGLVLHGLAGALIRGDVEAATSSSSNGNGVAVPAGRFSGLEVSEPVDAVQQPQGKDRKTRADRRGMPRRKVVRRLKKQKLEILECGHKVHTPSNWKKHKARACAQCAAEAVAV